MRISHKNKFIFLSNPKTGSTTVREILDPYSDIKSSNKKPFVHHIEAVQLKNIFIKNGWNWDEYYKFTFIRNPYEKYVSQYFFSAPDNNFKRQFDKGYNKKKAFSVSFKEWLKYHDNMKILPVGIRDIKQFAFDNNGNMLVNKIIKLEEINTELPKILNKLNINHNKIIKKINTTNHKNYRQYYDEECIKIVQKYMSNDIEIGNYEF